MTGLPRVSRKIFFCILTVLFSTRGESRETAPPRVRSFVQISPCEGFFTLGHPSELVIGSEERLDALISEGAIRSQDDVDHFDQSTYAAQRAHRIAEFRARRSGASALPPGIKLNWNDDRPALYTAALDEQSMRLQAAIRHVANFNDHAAIAVGDDRVWLYPPADLGRSGPTEVFVVRRSFDRTPTALDVAELARVRALWRGPTIKVHGILWLKDGDGNSLIIYR